MMTIACFFSGHQYEMKYEPRGTVLLCSRCANVRMYEPIMAEKPA